MGAQLVQLQIVVQYLLVLLALLSNYICNNNHPLGITQHRPQHVTIVRMVAQHAVLLITVQTVITHSTL